MLSDAPLGWQMRLQCAISSVSMQMLQLHALCKLSRFEHAYLSLHTVEPLILVAINFGIQVH